jgi:hypothetical protein
MNAPGIIFSRALAAEARRSILPRKVRAPDARPERWQFNHGRIVRLSRQASIYPPILRALLRSKTGQGIFSRKSPCRNRQRSIVSPAPHSFDQKMH